MCMLQDANAILVLFLFDIFLKFLYAGQVWDGRPGHSECAASHGREASSSGQAFSAANPSFPEDLRGHFECAASHERTSSPPNERISTQIPRSLCHVQGHIECAAIHEGYTATRVMSAKLHCQVTHHTKDSLVPYIL